MVKTKTKTKTVVSQKVKDSIAKLPSQVSAALYRLDESEKFQASIITRLELIEKHIDTISGKVNFITPAVGDNTTRAAQLDTIALTTAKDIEDIKTKMKDMLNMRMTSVTEGTLDNIISKDTQDIAKLAGTLKTVSQKVEQLSDRIIRIERKFLLGKDIVLPKKESDQAILKSVTATENKVDVHGKRLTSQAADIRMIQDSVRNLSQALDTLQNTVTNMITTNQPTSSEPHNP